MIPDEDSYTVSIPVTFDVRTKPAGLGNDKFILAIVVMLVWLATVIIAFFTKAELISIILYIIGSFIVCFWAARYLILRESYFKARRNELVEHNFQYPYSQFWNIYEIDNGYPHVCRFANGMKAVFVRFDKDVIVGRETNNEYIHYEAISEAYLQMHKRGIECVHIDYMDTVGKDDRVNGLFRMAGESENPDLSEVLTLLFDNVSAIMEHSYASYDVYCFYYQGKEDLFLDELEVVIESFMDGNYINYTFLDKEGINDLVKSIFNLNRFSSNYACDKLFSDLGGSHYITPIWVERGKERKILNKTLEEKAAEKAVREQERNLRKNRRRKTSAEKKMSKMQAQQEVNLWGDDYGGYEDYGEDEYGEDEYENYGGDGYDNYEGGYAGNYSQVNNQQGYSQNMSNQSGYQQNMYQQNNYPQNGYPQDMYNQMNYQNNVANSQYQQYQEEVLDDSEEFIEEQAVKFENDFTRVMEEDDFEFTLDDSNNSNVNVDSSVDIPESDDNIESVVSLDNEVNSKKDVKTYNDDDEVDF